MKAKVFSQPCRKKGALFAPLSPSKNETKPGLSTTSLLLIKTCSHTIRCIPLKADIVYAPGHLNRSCSTSNISCSTSNIQGGLNGLIPLQTDFTLKKKHTTYLSNTYPGTLILTCKIIQCNIFRWRDTLWYELILIFKVIHYNTLRWQYTLRMRRNMCKFFLEKYRVYIWETS